ncbi:MAG: hypothetical protein HRU70_02190 [Phycisphaeraceae bacterium]|nr:MAG: hypothetical protein HRU70_02190 [Phycisphaeraceae bacterium]
MSRHSAYSGLTLLVSAGVAAAAIWPTGLLAAEPVVVVGGAGEEVGVVGSSGLVYVHVASGTRVVFGMSPRQGEPLWMNNDRAGNENAVLYQSGPARTDGRQQYVAACVDWGDITEGVYVDAFAVAYGLGVGPNGVIRATAANPDVDPTVYGLDLLVGFMSSENGFNDPDRAFIMNERIRDLNGVNSTNNGWVYLIDLGGTGREFTVSGRDEDGDGRTDFGFYYQFLQNQDTDERNPVPVPRSYIGPQLVLGLDGGGSGFPFAYGTEDAFDWFNAVGQVSGLPINYHSTRSFGGVPWSDFYMELYGSLTGPRCPADFNDDGFVDFFDFAAFVDCFEGFECPPGRDSDFNRDGFVDFFDFQDYVDAFDAGC